MAKPLPWFPFYPEKWLSSDDVALMSIAEEGAYHRLLCIAWMQLDCGLPDNDEALATLSRLGKAWPKSAQKIRSKFTTSEGRLFNKVLLEIWHKQQEKAAKAQASAGKRWHSDSIAREEKLQHSDGIAEAMHARSDSNSSSSSKEVTALQQQTALAAASNGNEIPPELVQSEYPQTLSAIRAVDPSVDEAFVRGLAITVAQKILSHSKFPDRRREIATSDEWIAKACRESFSKGPTNHRAGLLLKTVPNILVSWGVEKRQ